MRRVIASAVAIVAVAVTAWYSTTAVTPARVVASHVLFVVIPIVAAAAAWGTSLRRIGRWRLSWRLFAAGAASWTLGSLAWLGITFTNDGSPPFPSIADAFYLLSPVLMTGGLVLSPRFGTRSAAARSLFDGLMAAAALLVVAWPFHYAAGFGPDVLHAVVGFAYPALDMLLLAAAAGVFLRLYRREPLVPTALVGFAVIQAATDSIYGLASAGETYRTGDVIDLGWFASFSLLAFAALVARGVATARPAEHLSVATHLVPLAPVGAALLSLALTDAAGAGRLAATSVVVVAAAARQYLLAREHAALASGLEQQVAARSAALTQREQAYASLVHNSSDVIAVVNDDGVVQFASDAVADVFACSATDAVGQSLNAFVHPEDLPSYDAARARLHTEASQNVELRVRHADGGWLFTDCRLRREREGRILANVRDISARRVLEDKLRHLALTDGITGLASRAALLDHLEEVPPLEALAVILVDLDDFKVINDTAGHAAGDQALRDAAERIRTVAGPGAMVARLGGDEFAVALSGTGSGEAAAQVAGAVVAVFAKPFQLVDRTFVVGASVGVAVRDAGGLVTDLLRHADLAMYAAKRNGKNQVAVFSGDMHDEVVQFSDMLEQLRAALTRDELVAYYQPIVRTVTGQLHGFEALIRWRHPERGVVPPGHFLPLAEATGQIVDIGARILELACAQLAAWHAADPGLGDLTMSVNVDPQQLVPGFPEHVRSLLRRTGLPPGALTLEITERAFERHDEVVGVMRALRQVGVRLALDDFGTGYSSLSRLHDVTMDRVKIDRSFISQIESGASDSPLTKSALALCRALGVEAVAEGVETPEQLMFLQAAGCELSQGFLFASPLTADDATTLVLDIATRRDGHEAAARRRHDPPPHVALGGGSRAHQLDALLALAREVTGFETAYLTEIDMRRATQHVRRVIGDGRVNVFEGLSVAWNAALCRQMLDADLDFVPDLLTQFPDSRLAGDIGIRAFACIPVRHGDRVVGTFCVASADVANVDVANVDIGTLNTLRHLGSLVSRILAEDEMPDVGALGA